MFSLVCISDSSTKLLKSTTVLDLKDVRLIVKKIRCKANWQRAVIDKTNIVPNMP